MQSSGHLEFTGAPDPMAMMQALGSMQQDKLKAVKKIVQAMKTNSDPTSQEGIREHWKKMKDGHAKIQKMAKKGTHSFLATTQSWDVKKNMPGSSGDPSKCAPIAITDMGLGTTHRGRMIVGRISDIGGFWSMASGVFLIEDLCGAVVEVAVYNYPKDIFAQDFPTGREICIIEPYYKLRGDGSVGVRVDRPNEISDYPLPTTGQAWKDLGNLCVKHCPNMALVCYDSGLHSPNKAVLDLLCEENKTKLPANRVDQAFDSMLQVSKLLTNLSICEFNLKDFDSSLLYALLAFGLALDSPKAAFWIAKSLHSCGLENEARHFAAWYCRSDGENSASLREKFCLTASDIISLEDGASWINGNTPSILAKASKSLDIPESHCNGHWLKAKEQGNNCFKEGKTLEARNLYAAALSICPFTCAMFQDASFLISNKGAALLSIENSPIDSINGAISMLCAALLNCYGNGRAWVRVSRFLTLQGRDDDSLSFLEGSAAVLEEHQLKLVFVKEDLKTSPGSTLKIVKSERDAMQRRMMSRGKVKNISPVSTDEQLKQRIAIDAKSGRSTASLDEETVTCEQLYNMFKMTMMFGDSAKTTELRSMAGPTLGRHFENYSLEFMQSVGVPEGLDKAFVSKVLHWSYARDRVDPWFRALGWRMSWSEKGDDEGKFGKLLADDDDIFKRWHGNLALKVIAGDPAKYTQLGAIIDTRHMKPPNHYESRIRSNFVNCPHQNEVFFEGTCHLAIGFNDLNSLMNCKWMDAVETEHKGKPARFVGLEMNPFNVAKTLVITEMLANSDIPLEEVLQAWYSSVWSRRTLSSFRLCVRAVLKKGEMGLAPHRQEMWSKLGDFSATNVSDVKVASYLHHWLSVDPMDFKEARRMWLDNTIQCNAKMFRQISSCKRRKDMLAIAQYCLTGETFGSGNFRPDGLNAVGSLTYWQCPEGSPPLGEESYFNAFALEDLMTTFFEDKTKDIVQVFESRVILMLGNMRSKLLTGSLTIELYVGEVMPLTQPGGHDLVRFIATKVKPYTVGWSNVIDYMELGDLHDVGRAMSPHGDVVHYGYSMNWPTETYGANIIDFQMTKNYPAANNILDLALGENYAGGNPENMNMIKGLMTSVGANELFHSPDHDTPVNSASFVTAINTKKHWVEYFFGKAGGAKQVGERFESSSEFSYQSTNCGFNVPGEPIRVVIPSPLHRISTQIYLGWTYDPKLSLQHTVTAPSKMDMVMMGHLFSSMGMIG